jgi:hypothetical protein
LTDKDRNADFLKYLGDEQAFIATQRKNVVALDDGQRQELVALLLDYSNYYHGLFTIIEEKKCALDVESGDEKFTLILGASIVTILKPRESTNAMLNTKGIEQLQNWMRSVGVVKP